MDSDTSLEILEKIRAVGQVSGEGTIALTCWEKDLEDEAPSKVNSESWKSKSCLGWSSEGKLGAVEKLDSSPSCLPFTSSPSLPLSLSLLPPSPSSFPSIPPSSFHSPFLPHPPLTISSPLSLLSFISCILPAAFPCICPSVCTAVYSPYVHLSFYSSICPLAHPHICPFVFPTPHLLTIHLIFHRPRACSWGTLILPPKPFQNLLADSCPQACDKNYGKPLDGCSSLFFLNPQMHLGNLECVIRAHIRTPGL